MDPNSPVRNSFELMVHKHIGVISFDHPPVNALTQVILNELHECVVRALEDHSISALILIGTGRFFSAGQDIAELETDDAKGLDGNSILNTIEASSKPIIAAINGLALGGGFELALSCHYRIADPDAKVGLPEVNLGLIPGYGGTQRLPRLCGMTRALELLSSGQIISASTALADGCIDRISEGDLVDDAIACAELLLSEEFDIRRTSQMTISSDRATYKMLDDAYEALDKKKSYLPAPKRIIDSLRNAIDMSFDEGLAKENEYCDECAVSPQADALQHIFFAERQTTKTIGADRFVDARDIRKLAVIGGGTMGVGIATAFLVADIPVILVERDTTLANNAIEKAHRYLGGMYKRGKIESEQALERARSLISGSTDQSYADIADSDLVIEAVFEDMDVKKKIFGKLSNTIKSGAILASNTSALDLNMIASATGRPDDVVGMHFFSPAHIMKLVEIVNGEHTDDDVINTVFALTKRLGKIGVLSGVCHGFIANRIYDCCLRETRIMLLEGATPEQIDMAMLEFGMPMGPFAMEDMAGLDISLAAMAGSDTDADIRVTTVLQQLVEAGNLGQKSGAGFYRYEKGSRNPVSHSLATDIARERAAALGIAQRKFDNNEITGRCIGAYIVEAARVLEEGIAKSSSDIDVVFVTGFGFPRHLGGPLHYADTKGIDNIIDEIEKYRSNTEGKYGYWSTPPLLLDMAATGKKFIDL